MRVLLFLTVLLVSAGVLQEAKTSPKETTELSLDKPHFAIAVVNTAGAAYAVWVVLDSTHVVRMDAAGTTLFTAGESSDKFTAVQLPRQPMDKINALARTANIAVSEVVAQATVGLPKDGSTEL